MKYVTLAVLIVGLVVFADGAVAFFLGVNFITGTTYGPSLIPIYLVLAGIGILILWLLLRTITHAIETSTKEGRSGATNLGRGRAGDATGIAKRIKEAVDRMLEGDPEAALIPASIAVDATASQEYPNMKKGKAFKQFIGDNFPLIMKVASGGGVSGKEVRVYYLHPELTPDKDGCCSMKDIFWHVARCGLLHEAGLPPNLKFTPEGIIRVEKDSLELPASFVSGLIAAVIVSPVNKNELLPPQYGLNIGGQKEILLNDLWGKREELGEKQLLRLFQTPVRAEKGTLRPETSD